MDFLELTSAGRREAAPGSALHANPAVVAFHVRASGAIKCSSIIACVNPSEKICLLNQDFVEFTCIET
jgi:hypothetical protein